MKNIKEYAQFINENIKLLSPKKIDELSKENAFKSIVDTVEYIKNNPDEFSIMGSDPGEVFLDSCDDCIIDGEGISSVKPGFVVLYDDSEQPIERLLELSEDDIKSVLMNLMGTIMNEGI